MDLDSDDANSVTSSNYDKYLRLATDKNPSILLELDLEGNVKHVSRVWNSVIGTNRLLMLGKPVSNIILGSEYDKSVFHRALNMMLKDDNSYRVKFVTETGDLMPDSEGKQLSSSPSSSQSESSDTSSSTSNDRINSVTVAEDKSLWFGNGGTVELEAQGILVHDTYTQQPSHTMWIVKRFYDIDELDNLPYDLVKRLGFGAKIFSHYLQKVEDLMILDEMDLPQPEFELCRVCETMVPNWWLETHSQICVCEHRIESVVQSAHDDLVEQKNLIESLIDSLESDSHDSLLEYKNQPLPQVKSRKHSPSPVHLEKDSYSVDSTNNRGCVSTNIFQQSMRYPYKLLYTLKDLCEEALAVNTSRLQSDPSTTNGIDIIHQMNAFYQFSPSTEQHINQVLNWKSSFESSDPAITLLVQDTMELCRYKVDMVIRMDNTLKYSLKIKNEVDTSISQLIKERIQSNRLNVTQTLEMIPSIAEANTAASTASLPSSSIEQKLATPLPQRVSTSNNLFSDSYIGRDTIPDNVSFNSSKADMDFSKQFFQRSSSNSPNLSKSITPNQPLLGCSESSRDKADNYESEPDNPRIGILATSRTNPSTPKFTPNNHLNLPKLASSISLTPRRGSPVNFSTPGSYVQNSGVSNGNYFSTNMNILGSLSSAKSVTDNSPMLSPFVSAADGTPSTDTQQRMQPLSPLLLPTTGKSIVPSIKDYEIIKPISKGAYGSVYLAKKHITGEYFAIKVLRKSDMIAKNQVTNVKSERAIMMVQSDKPYVAKLYATFQTKENLFLVMEYLSGGDMATLIKMMGNLPEKWAKQYICEVIVGVEDMHKNGIIHHDLKPDNLLIDSRGHIKLTDFGLSRMGLLRRHKGKRRNSQYGSSRIPSVSSEDTSVGKNSNNELTQPVLTTTGSNESVKKDERSQSTSSSQTQLLSANTDVPYLKRTGSHVSFTMTSLSRSGTPPPSLNSSSNTGPSVGSMSNSNHHSRTNSTLSDFCDSPKDLALFKPNEPKQFFGTPDYLAPETIKGAGENDTCDWWSVGCIFFEFLFGYPPFHGPTIDDVFENILNGRIDWPPFPNPETEQEYLSADAKDLLSKLLVVDPNERLGFNGCDEIMNHPYFRDVQWNNVYEETPSFVPQVESPEDTDYFDLRGASLDELATSSYDNDDDYAMPDIDHTLKSVSSNLHRRLSTNSSGRNTPSQRLSIGSVLEMVNNHSETASTNNSPLTKQVSLSVPPHLRERKTSKFVDSSPEFGSFNYRNLNALDKANKDAITRLKSEHLSEYMHQRTSSASLSSSSSETSNKLKLAGLNSAPGSGSPSVGNRRSNSPHVLKRNLTASPSRRNSADTMSPQLSTNKRFSDIASSITEESLYATSSTSSPLASKFKSPLSPPSMSRSRKISRNSFSSANEDDDSRVSALSKLNTVRRLRRRSGRKSSSNENEIKYKMDVLLCEPIPIHRYRVTEDLESIGCSVVSVGAGDEMVRRATTGVKFDLMITAMKLPKLGAVDIAKLIRHTNSINCTTPIVALTVYYKDAKDSKVFDDVLEKPVSVDQLRKLISKYALMKSQNEEDTLLSDSEY